VQAQAQAQAQVNFLQQYFRYVENSETPLFYHRWCALSGIGALLGRQFRLPFGSGHIYPNMYIMLIGDPGARKSTSIKSMKRLLGLAGYKTFSADKTTKEKFLVDMEGKNDTQQTSTRTQQSNFLNQLVGTDNTEEEDDEFLLLQAPREAYVIADEFNDFLGNSNIEFLSLLGNLWDFEGIYRNRIKHGRSVAIPNPTVSILSGNTHAGFVEAFPPQAMGQGFLSRLLLVYGESTGKRITFPASPGHVETVALIETLKKIKAEVHGEATITDQARHALDIIYRSWSDLDDGRFKHYSTRRFTHLLKLCMVCAANRLSCAIDLVDVLLANTTLTYTESMMPKALGEFGKAKNTEAANKIMQRLYATTKPLNIQELWRVVSNDLEKITDLTGVIINLQQADKIQSVKGGFLPKQKPIDSRKVYCDFKLIKEMEH
jgi:hypothetical protein